MRSVIALDLSMLKKGDSKGIKISLPLGARILRADSLLGVPKVFVEINTDAPEGGAETFFLYETGRPLPEDARLYVDTVMVEHRFYHIYRESRSRAKAAAEKIGVMLNAGKPEKETPQAPPDINMDIGESDVQQAERKPTKSGKSSVEGNKKRRGRPPKNA